MKNKNDEIQKINQENLKSWAGGFRPQNQPQKSDDFGDPLKLIKSVKTSDGSRLIHT